LDRTAVVALIILFNIGCGLVCALLVHRSRGKWWHGLLWGLFFNVWAVLIAWFLLRAVESADESVKLANERFEKNAITLDPTGRYKAVIPKSIPESKLLVIAMADGQQAMLSVMFLTACNYPGMPRLLWVFPTKKGDGTVRWNAQDSDGSDVDLHLLKEGSVLFISKDFQNTIFWNEPGLRMRVTGIQPAVRSDLLPYFRT
jgi:hypothetical protein